LAFPKPLVGNDLDPKCQFTHKIADDGCVIHINSQEEVLLIGAENEPIIPNRVIHRLCKEKNELHNDTMKNSGRHFQEFRKGNSSKDFILSTFERDYANESSIRTASPFVQRQDIPSAFVMTRAQTNRGREQNGESFKDNQPSTLKENPPDSQVEISPNQPELKITWKTSSPPRMRFHSLRSIWEFSYGNDGSVLKPTQRFYHCRRESR